MELGFVFAAVRRHAFLVVAMAVLGVAAGLVPAARHVSQYQAVATLLIQSPSNGNGPIAIGDPDRYVASEVSTLGSATISDAVIKSVGVPATDWSVKFSQHTASNIVDVIVISKSPTEARDVANAFADTYIAHAKSTSTGTTTPADLAALQARLDALVNQLAALNTKLRAALPTGSTNIADSNDTVSLAQRDTTLLEYQRLLATKTQQENDAAITVNSQVVNHAVLPTSPIAASKKVLPVLGGIGGLLAGFALAMILGRFSKDVIDSGQFEEILGAPIVCTLPRQGKRRSGRKLSEDVERICASIASVRTSNHVRVAVASTRGGLDTGRLAANIAAGFGGLGDDVVLINASAAAVSTNSPAVGHSSRGVSLGRTVTVRPLTAANGADVARNDVGQTLSLAAGPAWMAIFDVGPILATAVAMESPRHVDVVVLIAPQRSQPEWQLIAIARLMEGARATVVPVLARVGRRTGSRTERPKQVAAPVPPARPPR